MADISKLEQQANLLFDNVAGWESSTLQRIGKRIGKYGKMSIADVKAINNIAIVKQDMEAITKELAKVTVYNISQIEQMYGELLEEQHLANQPLYDYRGKTFVPFAENRELQAIARAYAKTTGETMINLAKTKALCVLGANGKPIGMQKYYTDVLDKAVMQVTTGATDFHTAMRDSIIELGGSGVRVDYGGGVTRRLDTVVRQNLLWGAKQASTEYNTMIGEELGCDGIEVDWHSNPRPSHEFMQGKQYVLGKARTINGIHFESADEALERLQDYGCLHYKTPIICGISEPRYSPEELKRLNEQNAKRYAIDGKEYSGYEVTQMQRRLESSVRNEKTTRDLAKVSGDNALVKRCNERIKAYQGKYNEISEITGIQGDKKRTSVPRSTATVKSATLTKVEPPKQKAEEQKFKVAQGKDLSGKIDYSKGDYDFDIEKAMKEQGFDGLPRVVSDEEFEEALKKSNFYAERTYCAPTQEVLDAYRDQLYNGKWYVDCSEGGSQYGKGMYCAARYENGKYIIPKDNKIGWEMSHYQEIGASKGNNFAYTEGITLTEDAKIFELPHDKKAYEYISDAYSNNYMLTHATPAQRETVEKLVSVREKINNLTWKETRDFIDGLYEEADRYYSQLTDLSKEATKAMQYTSQGSKYPKMKDAGTLAAEMGYDAINAVGHGESGSYTVILNRTKCIFRKGGSRYGN